MDLVSLLAEWDCGDVTGAGVVGSESRNSCDKRGVKAQIGEACACNEEKSVIVQGANRYLFEINTAL